MTRSSRKFSVFEFDEEEEKVEKESARAKYKSLRCFGGCTGAVKIESSNDPIDIDDKPIDVDSGGETNSFMQGKQ
ncbi:hypothetical protein OIU79_001065 [Salix purpurea]|uniref:Uncharacterized protein n=1 Tax=Salix purpurea TaxID=77065 RepID=A0A9Q0V3J2_SALPP|nr:hypothetical protein OIU79_001065 [Salix purpurea]